MVQPYQRGVFEAPNYSSVLSRRSV